MAERLVVKRLDPSSRESFVNAFIERLVPSGQPRLDPLANTIDHLISLGARLTMETTSLNSSYANRLPRQITHNYA